MPTFDITDSSQDADLFGTSQVGEATSAPKSFSITDDSMDEDLFGRKYDTKPPAPVKRSFFQSIEDNYNSREAVNARSEAGDKVFGGAERVWNAVSGLPAKIAAQEQGRSAGFIEEYGSQPGATPEAQAEAEKARTIYRPQAVNDYFDATIKQEEADARTPLSLERQMLAHDLSKTTNILDSLEVIGKHKQAFAEQSAEGLAPFVPLSFLGPVAPAAGAGLMGVQEKADGMKRYLESKGIDYHDKEARGAYLADPKHLDEAESYGDIHAAAMMGAVVASAGLSKAANVGLDAAKVAGTARKVASVPVHIIANAVPFVGASHAANAATGEETTGAEDAQSLAMAVGFGAHGAISESRARTKADRALADHITNTTLENTLAHTGAAEKADTNVNLDIKSELEKKATEKAKEDAFAKAEQQKHEQDQQTADEKEAGFRTIALEDQFKGKSRVERAGDSLVERVPINPPAGPSPEQVQAERESAQKDEADRLDRVELGGFTEQLKKRQDQHTKKQALEDIKLDKGMRASEARRRRGIMDELITANPGADAATLAPLMRERLKATQAPEAAKKGAAPEAAQAATEGKTFSTNGSAQAYRRSNGLNESHAVTELPDGKFSVAPREKAANVSKPDNQLSDAEVRELSRQAGAYEPEPAMNMAGKKSKAKAPDFVDNVHGIVKKLVNMSGHASEGVQHLLLQKKLVLAPNAESIGRSDTGVGAYDRSTGKMYLYTDHLKAGDAAGAVVAALHESTHLGQFNDRNGRSSVLQHMMSKEKENAASKKIRAAADAGNTIAKAAVEKAKAASPDTKVQDLELTPYFVGEVAEHRQSSTLGRVGGVANDILSAGRSFVKEKLGVDLDLTMGDLHSAAMRTASEAAVTHVKPDGEGTFDMIAGRHATGIHRAEQEGRIYKGKVDHMDRFEVSDEKAELADINKPEDKVHYDHLINRESVPLQSLLHHYDLYANYPELRDLKVKMADLDNASGSYDMTRNVITLDRGTLLNALSSPKSQESLRNLVLHEVQHAVQNIEGFVPGNSAKYFMPKSLTRQYESARERMTKLAEEFELGRALKAMDFESRKQWDAMIKWARPESIKEMAGLFLHNDFGVHSEDRAIARYNQQYKEAAAEYKAVNEEHELARVKAYKTYLRDYGETEARNTEFRSRMTDKERSQMTPEDSMEFAAGGVPVGRTLDTTQYGGGKDVPESAELPDTFNMVGKEDTPEFKKWFGDSVAKNEDGSPRLFYTGTSKDVDFKSFNIPKNGAWFTADHKVASDYAIDNDSKGTVWDKSPGASPWATKEINTKSRVFPVYLKVERPYVVTDADHERMNINNYKKAQGQFFDDLRAKGHDSVIMGGTKADPTIIAILNDPTQIKSVNNKGTYSEKDNDVLNMAAPLNDRTTMPRRVGETEKQWQERIAKDNVAPLTKAIDSLFNANVSKELGRQIQVGWMAKRDRQYTSAERSISQYKAYFDKLTEDQRLEVIDDWENGRTVTDPDALEMFKAINPLMKDAINTIRKHDPDVLKNLREFYLPHVWKKPSRATAFFQTRGPLGGDKAFTKAKKWPTMKEAMEDGHLEPVTTNPAELAMLKMGELLKYAGLLESRAELVRRGLAFKAADKDQAPEGYGNVRDASFNGYLVHESVASDLNGYLSRGLSDVPGFSKVRYLENMMVAGKLGWSGFHAGFTTMDNFVTHAEVATRRMLSGDVNGGLIAMLKAPASIVMSPYEGGALNKLFLGEQPQSEGQAARWHSLAGVDEHTQALLDLVEKGGGRAYMDSSEWNSGINKEIQAIRQRKIGKAVKQLLPAVSDASGWLIHRKLVPAQKAAARVLMLKFELDRFAEDLGKDKGDYTGIIEAMHPDAAAQISRKVVNLIDDRLGHMSYDNQFWNPYAKHMAQLVVMAPGWVSGTLRTVTGGVADVRRLVQPEKINGPLDKAGKVNDAKFGRLTSRTSNLIVLSMVTAAASGTFMYMLTGQWPEEAKDYVHPKTGRKNADGTDERISWPTYAKEHFALVTHPVKELSGKLNQPLIQMAWELIHNADFSNTEIYDSKAGVGTQLKEIAQYVAEGFYKPISVSNADKADKMDAINPNTPELNKALRASAMFGMTPARAEIDHSDAENFINEKYFDTFPKGALSRDKREELSGKSEMANQIRAGGKPDMSDYSPKERSSIRDKASREVYSNRLKGVRDIEDRVEAWDLATPEERKKYDMKKIVLNNARALIAKIKDPDTKAAMQKRIDEIRNY